MSASRNEEDCVIVRRKRTEADLICLVLKKIISWGCTKAQNITFHDHIKAIHGDELGKLNKSNKKWVKDNLTKLNNWDCSNFDVTFLNSLIPFVCEKNTFLGTNEYQVKCQDPKSLESLIKKAKDERNKFVHESISNASADELGEISRILKELLKTAANVYNKDQQALDDALTELEKEILLVGKETFSTEWLCNFIKQRIQKGAIKELKEEWGKMSVTLPVPLINDKVFTRKHVYSQLKMMTVPDGTPKNEARELTLDKLVDGSQKQFVLIKGPPGAGKTVLSMRLMDLHLEKAEEMKKDLIVFLSCRTANQESFECNLKMNNAKTLSFIDEKDLKDVAPLLSITFIIDGYDEASKALKNIMRGIFETSKKCRQNWSFLILSRPQACEELQGELRKQGIAPITTVTLQPLTTTEEKRKFLAKLMRENPIEGVDESYLDNLPNEAVKMLNSPVIMCLFYALLARGEVDASTLNNEGTFLSTVFQEIKKDMGRRIGECCEGDENPEVTADIVLDHVSKLSLEAFSSDSYVILREKYDEFAKEMVRKGKIQHSREINFSKVLSSVLTPDKKGSYNFWHTTVQEYLAARYIIKKLESEAKSPFQWIRSKFRPNRLDANPFFTIIRNAAPSSSLERMKRSVLICNFCSFIYVFKKLHIK